MWVSGRAAASPGTFGIVACVPRLRKIWSPASRRVPPSFSRTSRVFGATKRPGQWLVGFALETDDQRFRALTKLERKSCDLIVLNGPAAMDAADNQVEVLDKSGSQHFTVRGVHGLQAHRATDVVAVPWSFPQYEAESTEHNQIVVTDFTSDVSPVMFRSANRLGPRTRGVGVSSLAVLLAIKPFSVSCHR